MKNNHCDYIKKGLRIRLFDLLDGVYASAKPCCHIHSTLTPLEARNKVKVTSAKDIMELKQLRYFRDYFESNDDLHPACLPCINGESKGLISPRMNINQKNYDGYDINKLDVILGNTCNLACPFCSSTSSSLIDKLAKKLDKENRPEFWIPLADEVSAGSKKTADVVAEILQHYKVHTLKLIGGEPFLKENWSKIAEVIDQDYCKDLRLEVTTNGTILNDEIFSRLSKTKKTHLRISIDSIGPNYEFIRWPHSWKKMEANIEYLKEKLDNFPSVSISVANLVNIFNFEFLPEIEQFYSDYERFVSYSTEIKPITHLQNYQNLPDHILDYVRDNVKSEILKQALVKGNNNYSKEVLKKEFKVLLAQRKMSAEDVIGPMTRDWLGL